VVAYLNDSTVVQKLTTLNYLIQAISDINRVMGDSNYAKEHPELIVACMQRLDNKPTNGG
jgi:hypothetical protein